MEKQCAKIILFGQWGMRKELWTGDLIQQRVGVHSGHQLFSALSRWNGKFHTSLNFLGEHTILVTFGGSRVRHLSTQQARFSANNPLIKYIYKKQNQWLNLLKPIVVLRLIE